MSQSLRQSPCMFVKLALAALAISLVAACSTPREFKQDSFDTASASALFGEAFNHLSDTYIERIDLLEISVAGLNGLKQIDPTVSVKANTRGGFDIAGGNGVWVSYNPPLDRDSTGWGNLVASALAKTRASSTTLAETAPDTLYTAILFSVTETLDGYSRYEPPKRATESRARREGYAGIGVTIRNEEDVTVIQNVIPGAPAARAGLQAEDRITHLEGVPLSIIPLADRASRLRGPAGTTVMLSIARANTQPFSVRITRANVIPATVFFETDKGLPRFRVTGFNRTTADDLAKAIAKAERRPGGLAGVVLDLRSNPGGYLSQATEIADLFLNSGTMLTTKGRHPASSSVYEAQPGRLAAGKPIILLLNGRSASASELLAAALIDAGRAAAVGSVTYGKGSIQNLEPLVNGGELIVTWSRMYAPSGYLLDKLGVRPTICTSNSDADADAAALIRQSRPNPIIAADWRLYRSPDLTTAASLRASCPKTDAVNDLDLRVARLLLENRNAYQTALSPAAIHQPNATLWQLRRPAG